MKDIIKKADVLIEALPYIQQFRGETVVVKFGGSAMEDPAHIDGVLADITFMECVGMLPVIVHGGGKAISQGMKDEGIEPHFLHGLRVTCGESIKVVERVLKEEVNPRIIEGIIEKGGKAKSLHGDEILNVTRKKGVEPSTGEKLDWGFVGEPGEVNVAPILSMLKDDVIPVITPLGRDPDGNLHNVNADVAAATVAKELKARKLVFLSDVPGLLRNPADQKSRIKILNTSEVEELIDEGVIAGGMLPKVTSCVEALHAGVRQVHMVDGRMPHSLLLEVFTEKGVGTQIID